MAVCYFVTGTDTSVGKTTATCALLRTLVEKTDHRVAGFKPVATGAKYTEIDHRYYNDDALKLKDAANIDLHYDDVNPYCFPDPTSPHIASARMGMTISLSQLSDCLGRLKSKADIVLVEGAGGWHTPLGKTILFSEWVRAETLPVILIVPLKLGCLNHALLTQQAILQAGIPLAGWILNHIIPPQTHDKAYRDTLIDRIIAPLIGTVWYGGNQSEFCLSLFDKE